MSFEFSYAKKQEWKVCVPYVSVVILTYNSSFELDLCLISLCKQKGVCGEVQTVVVDDGSSDNTAEVVSKYIDLLHINYYVLEHTGIRGENRNFGVTKAKADRLLFIDGDMILSPDFVKRHLENIERDHKCISLGKRFRPFKTDNRKITSKLVSDYFEVIQELPALDDERLIFANVLKEMGVDSSDVFGLFFSHNICIWKSAFESVGGFDNRFSKYWGTEDVELGFRLVQHGYHIKFDESILGYHLFSSDDVQNKIRQLRKNLRIWREKSNSWEVELASVEHMIWPFRYLNLRKKVLSGKHVIHVHGWNPEKNKIYALIGVDIGKAFPNVDVFGVPGTPDKNFSLGLFLHEVEKSYDQIILSAAYEYLGKTFMEIVQNAALQKSAKVLILPQEAHSMDSSVVISELPKLKRLIITVSDTELRGMNKVSFYRLGLGLKKLGVDVGFSLAGDIFENSNRFESFNDIGNVAEQTEINKLFDHDLFLDVDCFNLMDGLLGGGIGRSVDRRVLWQEPTALGNESNFVEDNRPLYSKIILKNKYGQMNGEPIISLGVNATQIKEIAARYERYQEKNISLLWICPNLDELSGLDKVLSVFDDLKCEREHICLRIVYGKNTYASFSKYLNKSSKQMLINVHEQQRLRENRIESKCLERLNNRSDIKFYCGIFNEDFIVNEIAKSDVVIDTSPSLLICPWIVNAFALNKKVVIGNDDVYAAYKPFVKSFKYEILHKSGVYGELQTEFFSHGDLSNARYLLFREPELSSFSSAIIEAVNSCKVNDRFAGYNKDILENFNWEIIARKFLCIL